MSWNVFKMVNKAANKAVGKVEKAIEAKRDPGIYEDWKPAKPKTSPVAAIAAKPMPPAPAPTNPAVAPTARPTGAIQKTYTRAMELKEESLNAYAKRDPIMVSHELDKKVQRGEMTREQATWIINEARKRRRR